MSFTFTNDPANSNRDAVRILIDDRTDTGHQLSDETIAWLIADHNGLYYAAAQGADIIAGQFSDAVSEKSVGDLKIKKGAGDPVAKYKALAAQLRTQAAIKGFKAFSGGITISGKQTELDDTDRLPDEAAIGMHDNDDHLAGSTSGRMFF